MISLFENYPKGSTGVVFPPQWNYIKSGINRNIEKVKTFYQLYPIAVPSQHFLVRLIESIEIPMDLTLDRYYSNVDAIALNVSMAMRMTSARAKGKCFNGIFYGEGSTEVLLAVDDYFDYQYVNDNWESVSAITTLMHPKSDMDLILPFGKSYSNEHGLSVIMINIPMLMVQYRAFRNKQPMSLSGAPKSIYQFIGGYVIPNMLESQTEIALFNRIYKAANDNNDGNNETAFKHSFNLPYFNPQLDLAIKHILGNIKVGLKIFPTILKTLPSFKNNNLYQSLLMPDVIATTQVDWLLMITRMKVIDFLIKTTGYEARLKNQAILNQIQRSYHINNVSSMINQMLPQSIGDEMAIYQKHLLDAMDQDFI